MAIRGCGTRVPGGIYLVLELSPVGRPVEDFLIDPPVKIDPSAAGVSPLGVTLMDDANGVTHVLDWIGSQHYPNVADFIEEVRQMGISRRVSKALDFSRITRESTLITIHARAWIENYPEREHACQPWLKRCPRGYEHGHLILDESPAKPIGALTPADVMPGPVTKLPCVRAYWDDVAVDTTNAARSGHPRSIVRTMPSCQYAARTRPASPRPEYAPAMFARWPLGKIVVIRDQFGGSHEDAADAASDAGLPVVIEEE